MAIGIDRPQTEAEKEDYQALGTVTPKQRFRKALEKVEQQFTRDRKPFDAQCARADFNEQVED